MTEPKRHHFVPQLVLRNFTDGDGKVHVHDRRRPQGGVFSASPPDVFVRQHFYSEIRDDGNRDARAEKELARREAEWGPVVEKIVSSVLAGAKPNLTARERSLWDTFFITQWRRTPSIRQRLLASAGSDDEVISAIHEAMQLFPQLREEAEGLLRDAAARARLSHNSLVRSLQRPLRESEQILASRGLIFLTPAKATKQFILGEDPVTRLNVKGSTNHLADPTSEIWLPIHPKVLVGPSSKPAGEDLAKLGTDVVRVFNEQVADRCSAVASASRALLQSLRRGV